VSSEILVLEKQFPSPKTRRQVSAKGGIGADMGRFTPGTHQ